MRSYGYSPAWGVIRTPPQPIAAPARPEPEAEAPPQSGSRRMTAGKWERMRQLAAWKLHDGSERVPPPGVITVREAAERLGVTQRVIQRYKRELAQPKTTPPETQESTP